MRTLDRVILAAAYIGLILIVMFSNVMITNTAEEARAAECRLARGELAVTEALIIEATAGDIPATIIQRVAAASRVIEQDLCSGQ